MQPSDTQLAKRPLKRLALPAIIVALLLCVAAGLFIWSASRHAATNIDNDKYQAVFLANGQVYFGKLQPTSDRYMKLTDIYYLQAKDGEATTSENPQQTTSEGDDVQLIKLGNEVHGPEDEMMITKDQILFYENLKADSSVAKTIDKYHEAK